jgi:hypothetical protein
VTIDLRSPTIRCGTERLTVRCDPVLLLRLCAQRVPTPYPTLLPTLDPTRYTRTHTSHPHTRSHAHLGTHTHTHTHTHLGTHTRARRPRARTHASRGAVVALLKFVTASACIPLAAYAIPSTCARAVRACAYVLCVYRKRSAAPRHRAAGHACVVQHTTHARARTSNFA